jgi:hypothetical protein
MLKWARRIASIAICATLATVISGPWIVYRLALNQIVGRPSHASEGAPTAEAAETLWRKLRNPMPIRVEPLSPYRYLWALACGEESALPPGTRLAWMVAKSHNTKNLKDRRLWHPAGAALTIWLTRNWTTDELIAKGIELDRTRPRRAAP